MNIMGGSISHLLPPFKYVVSEFAQWGYILNVFFSWTHLRALGRMAERLAEVRIDTDTGV